MDKISYPRHAAGNRVTYHDMITDCHQITLSGSRPTRTYDAQEVITVYDAGNKYYNNREMTITDGESLNATPTPISNSETPPEGG